MSRPQLTVLVGGGLAVLALAWLISTGAVEAAPSGKSGGRAGVVLELAVLDQPGKPGALLAEQYARRVEALSHGSIRITVTSWPTRFAHMTPTAEIDADAIRAIRSASVELGLIPSYAFEAHGVTSLRALQAPFVLRSVSQAAGAVSAPAGERLLAGLEPVSLAGVGLVPEGMVRGFGFLKSLSLPADYAGVRVRADSSKTTRDVLRLLGARRADFTANADTVLVSGFVDDAEVPAGAEDDFPANASTASEVPVFPKVDVVVASSAVFAHLTRTQRSILRQAAGELRATVAADGERAAAAAYCSAGGTVEEAPPAAKAAFRAKTAPILKALRRDSLARAYLATAERIASEAGGALPTCSPESTAPPPGQRQVTPNPLARKLVPPLGSFRRAFTSAELRAAGADEAEAARSAGVTMLTLYGLPREHWRRFVLEWKDSRRAPCRGGTEYTDRHVELYWNPTTPCQGFFAFRWRRTTHGDLELVSVHPLSEPPWARKAYIGVWKRVDCTPGCGAREKLTAGEVANLLASQIPTAEYIACHQAPRPGWDYECHYAAGWDGETTSPTKGKVVLDVNVDTRGITEMRRR